MIGVMGWPTVVWRWRGDAVEWLKVVYGGKMVFGYMGG